ncbi:MAG TPA: DUF922 domain-containing protein [Steroidobacteraceae bacterium]|jgi:predicted secreted Zn-dependent protease
MQPRRALLYCTLLAFGVADADLTEQLDYTFYDVPVHKGASLGELLAAASPVHVNGKVYHAYTRWNVNWHYHYLRRSDGRCGIDSVATQLTATMTLPAPADPALAHDGLFVSYLKALKRHEQGHYEIGRNTASSIDDGIFSLPARDSCDALAAAAEALANARLARAREIEQRYDRDTGFGRSQGAWLD